MTPAGPSTDTCRGKGPLLLAQLFRVEQLGIIGIQTGYRDGLQRAIIGIFVNLRFNIDFFYLKEYKIFFSF